MKRFMVFAGDVYYPAGGASDLLKVHAYDTVDEASAAIIDDWQSNRVRGHGCYWAHIYDTETDEIVLYLDEYAPGYQEEDAIEKAGERHAYEGWWHA